MDVLCPKPAYGRFGEMRLNVTLNETQLADTEAATSHEAVVIVQCCNFDAVGEVCGAPLALLPEPGVVLGLLAGLLVLYPLWRRRRNKRATQ